MCFCRLAAKDYTAMQVTQVQILSETKKFRTPCCQGAANLRSRCAVMAPSSSGQDSSLSRRSQEFESPWSHQYTCGRSSVWLEHSVWDGEVAGSSPVSRTSFNLSCSSVGESTPPIREVSWVQAPPRRPWLGSQVVNDGRL